MLSAQSQIQRNLTVIWQWQATSTTLANEVDTECHPDSTKVQRLAVTVELVLRIELMSVIASQYMQCSSRHEKVFVAATVKPRLHCSDPCSDLSEVGKSYLQQEE